MDLGLKDKVVVITGGALGIGAAVSEGCAAEGAIPVMVNRDSEAAQSFAARLREAGKRCELLTIELEGPDSCRQAIEETLRRRGRIDALVNNAGTNDKVGTEHGTPQGFIGSIHRNLWHYPLRAALTEGRTDPVKQQFHRPLPRKRKLRAFVPAEVMTPQYEKWIATFPNPEEKLRTITSKIPLGKRMT